MEALRIVLADDHALFREGTRGLLERDTDLTVVGEAANGLEAVELVDRLAPDVAILDIEMPELDGLEATRRIKEANPYVAVLILTMHDDEAMVMAMVEAGAAGYLLKDVPSDSLTSAVKALHAGESVLHPTITRRLLDHLRSPDPDATSALTSSDLSSDELTVLRLAAAGRSNREIAEELEMSVRTAQLRMTQLFERFQVASRTEVVVAALRQRVISLDDIP